MRTTFMARRAIACWRGICNRAAPDYAMVGFVLRNTLSDFGAVARGVCQVSDDGYLKAIAELTDIERDGDSCQKHGRRRQGDHADGRRAGLNEILGIYSADLWATGGALQEIS